MKQESEGMTWQTRTMTAEEYGLAVRQLGMSVAASGRFLGISARQATRYVKGEVTVEPAHALLLNFMIHHNEKPVVPRRVPGSY